MGFFTGLILFSLIILVNSIFVIAEIALLTSRKNRIQKSASQGSNAAKNILKLYRDPEKLLSTVLIGITSVGVASGMLGGDTISEYFETFLNKIPFLSEFSKVISDTLTILIVVYMTVCSELIPKRIAMLHPEKAAISTSYIMLFFYYLFYPLMMLLSVTSNWALKILKIKENKQELSVEEFKMMLQQVEGHGSFDQTEAEMMRRLLNLGNMQVGAVMTPRSQMVCLDISDSEEINIQKIINNPFNYFPVTDRDPSNIIGFVSAKQFLNNKFSSKNIIAFAKSKSVLYVPEMANLTNLMARFRENQMRTAIVVDEYGGIEGIVTLNDILKTFVGDLATLVDGQKPTVQRKKMDYTLLVAQSLLKK